MQRPSLTRFRGQHLLVAAASLCASYSCQSEDSPGSGPGPTDGTNTENPGDMGGPDMGSTDTDGDMGDPSMGTSGEGIPTPSLTGNEGQGGASAAEGTGAPDDMPLFASFTWNSMIQARISPSGVLHVAQFGGASTVYRMNYVGGAQQ